MIASKPPAGLLAGGSGSAPVSGLDSAVFFIPFKIPLNGL
jgi:hypothetical protein